MILWFEEKIVQWRTVAPSFCDRKMVWLKVEEGATQGVQISLYMWEVGAIVAATRRALVKISTVPFTSEAHDFGSFSLVSSDRNFIRSNLA